MAGGIEVTVDARQLRAFGASMAAAADGKALRTALLKEIRAEAKPLVTDLREAIGSAPSKGLTHGESLRSTVAGAINSQIRLTGAQTGISVRAKQTPKLRGFKNAARRFNRDSFRHPVFKSGAWAVQVGLPGWFDKTTAAHKPAITAGVIRAVEETAATIALRARGI